jgi:excisionase family DNA binding protein
MGRPKLELPAPDPNEAYVGTTEAAAMLKVSISTVQKMCESGQLQTWRTRGGHRRIALQSVKEIAGDIHAPAPVRIAAPGALRLLIVEDNATTVRTYEKMLKVYPANQLVVDFSPDGAQALLQIARRKPDVLITDLVMEPFDGFYLIKSLRKHHETAELPIVVVTSMSEADIRRKGPLDARTLCYRKPGAFERLRGYVDALMQMRNALPADRL